jgi:hypothetical protein
MIEAKDIVCVDYSDFAIVSDDSVQKIIDHTQNTWQPNRDIQTKKKDTELGKIAEWCVEKYIKENIKNLNLLTYDDFRINNFNKHAPLDCLLFSESGKQNIKDITAKINDEVTSSAYGSITDELKQECLKNRIYICEIKSTKITQRHKTPSGEINFNTILNDDFLSYPKYLRIDKTNSIKNIIDYINYVNNRFNSNNRIDDILKIEFKNMSHIYIRVYIDELHKKAYIIGMISANSFIDNLVIKHMPQYNKSESALYLATKIRNGVAINLLSRLI